MSGIFLQIFNMSVSASYIVLAVLLLRLILRKAPKWIMVFLWGIVALRLICPFSIESALSLIPSAEVVSPSIMTESTPIVNTGIPIINSTVNPIISESLTPTPNDSADPLQTWIPILSTVWLVGILALLIYTVISYVRVKSRIGTAVICKDNIYQSESVISPFVLGVIKPKIYLPFNISEHHMMHVIAHENAHIRRKDHLWKPLGFLLLALHWFNPLMWLGYVLLCRDIELACDEKVIRELDRDARADYSEALLTCSVNRRMIAACPLAFGEVSVKNRVRSVLNYKKPAFWIIIAAVVACIVVAVCFLTDPLSKEKPDDQPQNDETTASQEELIGSADNGESYINTEYEGVYITIESTLAASSEGAILTMVWHNETDQEITYGDMFFIESEYDGEWTVHSFGEDYVHPLGYLLKGNETQTKTYKIPYHALKLLHYPIRITIPFTVKEGDEYVSYKARVKSSFYTTIKDLRTHYPDFFDLNTDEGLTVYIWQLAESTYSCYLVSTAADSITDQSYAFPYGISIPEMKHILSTYSIGRDKIELRPIKHPISSYDYTIDAEYRQKLENEFWPPWLTVYPSTIFDKSTFDIDNDGIDEICVLAPGPVSGVFSFFALKEEALIDQYYTSFYSDANYLSFENGVDGITRVKAETIGNDPQTCLYEISIKDGDIDLSQNRESLRKADLFP